ncbi:FkbM family methyltransferase [Xanthobacteraceae bacterium Astr-EGSB]|uniref:FkbM family methyltransferase n=1 Tax=Astrobacterium formosum TaxID=3069710 RepID=UPI0027B2E973|nr:FkbM family methyltransferase [Xanthobacteraceae bacterium Astr-EGSB]
MAEGLAARWTVVRNLWWTLLSKDPAWWRYNLRRFFFRTVARFKRVFAGERAQVTDGAALLNSGTLQADMDRLSELYESIAVRLALLETTRGESAAGACATSAWMDDRESNMSDTADGESPVQAQTEASIFGELQLQFVKALEASSAAGGDPFPFRRLFDRVAQEFARRVIECDRLMNERDAWFRERQVLSRKGGISPVQSARSEFGEVEFPLALNEDGNDAFIEIVDVGAQNLTSEDHVYSPIVRKGVGRVIGFEPLQDEADARAKSDPSAIMLNHFIGDGSEGVFHESRFNPTSSLLAPNEEFLSQFIALPDMCRTVATSKVTTTRLDDVPEVKQCDFLKIDVQGGELGVLRGAERLLESVAVVHCEVEFAPIYRGQPLFADIDAFLRARGFELMDLINSGYASYASLARPIASSRLVWADAVYFKSPTLLGASGPGKLLKAAYIAHVNYGMYDLAGHYLAHLDQLAGKQTKQSYSDSLTTVRSDQIPSEGDA